MITGFFNINKPAGLTSAKVVSRVKRIINQRDLGHMGTLDPMATGVLIVAAGRQATKMFDELHKRPKEYIAEFKFGIDTDTLDITGTVLSEGGRIPDDGEILKALPSLTGKISQIPPAYSAKSVNGVKAYKLARRGETFDLKPKTIEVFSFNLLSCNTYNTFRFKIVCGGGTYIRSLARDLGALLGTKCVMSGLVRTMNAGFRIENAVTLEELEKDYLKYLQTPRPDGHPSNLEGNV